MALPEVLAAFDDHIARLPSHFIDLERLCLVDTHTFREAHLAMIASVGEADVIRHTSHANQPREDVIGAIVKGVLKYAVLSHSWDWREVLYQDMACGVRQSGPGWDKLVQFSNIARVTFNCRFAWADPVCIDKTNPSVLQKALISRFDYFRNAYVCVAYLDGTSDPSNMDQDRWFYRGFTLTELLAPIRTKFYGMGWEALNNDQTENDKADEGFLKLLSAASGIPVGDLRIFWPGPDRIRDKLTWASRQRSTRLEDDSYTLIAIFDSHIPVIYGEGRNTFTKLMMDIIPRSGECDAFAWAGPCSDHFPWLPLSPAGFGEQHCDQRLHSTPHHYRLCGDRSVSIDYDHLRIRVILLQVSSQPIDRKIYRPFLRHSASVDEVTLLDPKNLPRKTSQLAIGVIDYGWTDNQDEGVLRKGDRYFGFLLWYSSDKKWRKLQTGKTVLITNGEELVQRLTLLDIRA